MIAKIVSNQWVYFDNITPYEEAVVSKYFSVSNPHRQYIDDASLQGWDGVSRFYQANHRRLPRPMLGALMAMCAKRDIPVVVDDLRDPPTYSPIDKSLIGPDFLPGITLTDYQVEAIRKSCNTEVGLYWITTGGGKSELMAGICKAIPCPTAIIADSVQIIVQLCERLKLRKICDEPGMFYAGKMPSNQMILIGSIQSLSSTKEPDKPDPKKYKTAKSYEAAKKRYDQKLKAYKSRTKKSKLLKELIRRCDMLLVDEADTACSATYKNLFRYWFVGRRRYGFTGTANDPDKPLNNMTVNAHLGSVIYKQTLQQVQDTGLIVPLEYYMVAYGEDGNRDDASAYDIAVNEMIVYSERFHKFIASLCKLHEDEGTLILVDRDDLGYALNDLIPNSAFIHGKTPRNQRPAILKAFEDRELKVLIGGKNVRRGLDLKGGCENLILTTSGKLWSEFDQKLGRARRRNAAGKARVYDVLFLCNKYLYAHSRSRLKAVVGMGYKSYVVYPDGAIDAAKFIKSRFRRPNFKKLKKAKQKSAQRRLFDG